MALSYSFAVVRLAPDNARSESVNIGLVVFKDDHLDVRAAVRSQKVRSLSLAATPGAIREFLRNMEVLDAKTRQVGGGDVLSRYSVLSRVGPLQLSPLGHFSAGDASTYETRIGGLIRNLVDPEINVHRVREKRTTLLTEVKNAFRSERVLARKHEELDSHRIVPRFQVDEGLVADLALKNGAMHLVETVDASSDRDALRKAITDIAISGLVLERARMKFREDQATTRLVYVASPELERYVRPSLDTIEHQGADMTNWASADDRHQFIVSMAALAQPYEGQWRTRRN